MRLQDYMDKDRQTHQPITEALVQATDFGTLSQPATHEGMRVVDERGNDVLAVALGADEEHFVATSQEAIYLGGYFIGKRVRFIIGTLSKYFVGARASFEDYFEMDQTTLMNTVIDSVVGSPQLDAVNSIDQLKKAVRVLVIDAFKRLLKADKGTAAPPMTTPTTNGVSTTASSSVVSK